MDKTLKDVLASNICIRCHEYPATSWSCYCFSCWVIVDDEDDPFEGIVEACRYCMGDPDAPWCTCCS